MWASLLGGLILTHPQIPTPGPRVLLVEAGLAKAEPAADCAMAAAEALNAKDLQLCKTMSRPPPGVTDVFGACCVLLAGVLPTVVADASGKVRDAKPDGESEAAGSSGSASPFSLGDGPAEEEDFFGFDESEVDSFEENSAASGSLNF